MDVIIKRNYYLYQNDKTENVLLRHHFLNDMLKIWLTSWINNKAVAYDNNYRWTAVHIHIYLLGLLDMYRTRLKLHDKAGPGVDIFPTASH